VKEIGYDEAVRGSTVHCFLQKATGVYTTCTWMSTGSSSWRIPGPWSRRGGVNATRNDRRNH